MCGLSTISGELVERYTPAVRAAALSEVRDPELVDDIVQDTASKRRMHVVAVAL